MAYATTEQTFIKRAVNANLQDAPEMEILLPPGVKLPYPHRIPSAKDSAYNSDDYKGRTLESSPDKDTIYFNNEVADMIRTLQMQVESLRERVDLCKKTEGDAVYETIDSRRLKKAHHTTTRKRAPSTVDNNNGSNDSWKKYMRDRGFHRLGYVIDPEIGRCRKSYKGKSSPHGLRGLRYLLDPKMGNLKRSFLVILFLCCLCLFVYQLRDRVLLYLSHPTSTDIDVEHLDSLQFPDVTICNLNKFRLTRTVEKGLFPDIHKTLHDDLSIPRDTTRLYRTFSANLPYVNFIDEVSHRKADFVHSCTLNNDLCELSDFNIVTTDLGNCFTFNPKSTKRKTLKADSTLGLSMVFNVEQYEYLLGPRSAVGVRVAVHEPGRIPLMAQEGVNAAVGTHTSIGLKKMKHIGLPPPHGECVKDRWRTRHREVCLEDCEARHVIDICNCTMTSFPDTVKECTVRDYFTCVMPIQEGYSASNPVTYNISSHSCGCHQECDRVSYSMDVSNAATSVYAAESFVRTLPDVTTLQEGFERARDIYHRVDDTIYSYDDDNLRTIAEGFNESIFNITEFFLHMKTYKQEYVTQLTTLQEAVESLNETVREKHGNFKQASHVTFYSLDNTVKTRMMEIVDRSQIRDAFPSMSQLEVNDTLKDIQKKLGFLVVSKDHGSWIKKSILTEMTEGVKGFENQLIKGYGQMYHEFRESRQFYSNLITSILRTINLLTTKLMKHYDRVKALTKLPNLKDPKIVDELEAISREINSAADVNLEELVKDLDELFEEYTKQKDQILKLIETLLEIGGYFSETINTIQKLLSTLGDLVESLRKEIETLRDEIVILRKAYNVNQFGKSELARSFNKENLSGLIETTKNFLKSVVQKVEDIRKRGEFIAHSVKPLEGRLSDFILMKPEEVKKLIQWLKFPTIKSESELLRSTLERTNTKITDYGEELEEYTRNNRIDGEFYQNNFLQLEIYFQEISETKVIQQVAYGLFSLACDVGGLSALFIGASILTLFEAIDMLFGMACVPKEKTKQPKPEGIRADYTDVRPMTSDKCQPGRSCADPNV